MVISFYRLCGQRKQVSNVEVELFVQCKQIPADFVTPSCNSKSTPRPKQRYTEKMLRKKIKCKTIVTINSIKLGVLLAKIYTCYDVFYRLYTVCTVLMKYMYTVQLLYVCWIKYWKLRLDFFLQQPFGTRRIEFCRNCIVNLHLKTYWEFNALISNWSATWPTRGSQ